MHKTSLRRVGGSVMVAVPPAVLELLNLRVGSVVGLGVDGERLVIVPQKKPRYTLDDLLAQFDPDVPISLEDRQWIDMPLAGNEL
jgi:antitoxin ChpS